MAVTIQPRVGSRCEWRTVVRAERCPILGVRTVNAGSIGENPSPKIGARVRVGETAGGHPHLAPPVTRERAISGPDPIEEALKDSELAGTLGNVTTPKGWVMV
jgi:hypothetical protein